MICIFVKGKQTRVIGSPNSASWKIKPGDEYYPDQIYKSAEAFTKKWKELEKSRYKLVKYTSSAPKTKSKKSYYVKISNVAGLAVPTLLKDFAVWLKKQPYGSIGWFELITKKIPKQLAEKNLFNNAISFISLPDGSEVALSKNGSVTFLDSEGGKPKIVATNLRVFLNKLASGKTKVMDLDDNKEGDRKPFQAWLKAKK